MEWSKGVIFLMATFWPEGLCMAELGKMVSHDNQCTTPDKAPDSPDDTIGTFADDVLNVILLADVERDLAGTRRVRSLGPRHIGSRLSCRLCKCVRKRWSIRLR